MTLTRIEHLAWCKRRALEYLIWPHGSVTHAANSLISDLRKHDATRNDPAILRCQNLISMGCDAPMLREFIEAIR